MGGTWGCCPCYVLSVPVLPGLEPSWQGPSDSRARETALLGVHSPVRSSWGQRGEGLGRVGVGASPAEPGAGPLRVRCFLRCVWPVRYEAFIEHLLCTRQGPECSLHRLPRPWVLVGASRTSHSPSASWLGCPGGLGRAGGTPWVGPGPSEGSVCTAASGMRLPLPWTLARPRSGCPRLFHARSGHPRPSAAISGRQRPALCHSRRL